MPVALFQVANVARAIEETITTPMPGIGHGRLGDIAAGLTWVAGFLGLRKRTARMGPPAGQRQRVPYADRGHRRYSFEAQGQRRHVEARLPPPGEAGLK